MLLSMALAMTSCGSVGLMIHTAKIYDGVLDYNAGGVDVALDTVHFVIDKKNRMLLKAEINGKTDTVMYDSGVNSFAALMYTPSTKPQGMKFYSHSVSGADKKSKIKVTTLPVKIRTDMVVSKGLGMATLNPEPPVCDKEAALSKYDIIGFQGLNLPRYMIDFTNNQMYEIRDTLSIDTTEFVPVKCKYYMNVLWVYPRINGVEYECMFDTGNGAAGILLQDEQRIEAPRNDDYLFEGSYGVAIGGHTEKQHFVVAPEEHLSMAGDDKEVDVMYAGMLEYDRDLHIPQKYLVTPPQISHTLTELLVENGIPEYACSETQKYGHVTFFWNGNRSEKFSEELETIHAEIKEIHGKYSRENICI